MATLLGLIFLLPEISFCQDKTAGCDNIHHGLFYYYPKNSTGQYTIRMDGQFEHLTDIKTGDTTISRVKWNKNCSYSEKYIKGNIKLSNQSLHILKSHTFVYKVGSINKDYYTFTMFMDKISDLPIADDTLWLTSRDIPTNHLLCETVINSYKLKHAHFSDTSGYALLYLYRPGKFTNSLNLYPVYFDNVEICIAENNTGYLFKVFKEGPLKITGTLFNHSSHTTLPVQFGHIYYVKTKVHWGAGRNNNHIVMEIVDARTGKKEFASIKHRSL